MWKCEKCGNENTKNFCPKCGSKMPDDIISGTDNREDINYQDNQTQSNQIQDSQQQISQNDNNIAEQTKRPDKAVIIFIVAVLAILIVAAGACAYLITNQNKTDVEQNNKSVKVDKNDKQDDKDKADNKDKNNKQDDKDKVDNKDKNNKQDDKDKSETNNTDYSKSIADITYDDIKSEMSEDEFDYYLYAAKMQYIEENDLLYSSEQEQQKFLDAKNGDKTNSDIVRQRAIDNALGVIAQCREAEKRGFTFTEDDEKMFDEQLEMMYTQYGGKEIVQQQLDEMGITFKGFEEFNKRYLILEKLYGNLMESGELDSTNEEIKKHIKSSNYIKAKHILISTQNTMTGTPLSDEQKATKKALAEDILKRIKSGEDYDALMNELSEDPGLESNPTGYIFTKGEMVPAFEQASYALDENEVSEIVESDYGYHIIKRVSIDVESLSEQEKQTLTESLRTAKVKELSEKWKAEYIKELQKNN